MPRTGTTGQLTLLRTKLRNTVFLQDLRIAPQIVNRIKKNEKKEKERIPCFNRAHLSTKELGVA